MRAALFDAIKVAFEAGGRNRGPSLCNAPTDRRTIVEDAELLADALVCDHQVMSLTSTGLLDPALG